MVVEIKDQENKRDAYTLEEVEVSRALFELYEGAVVLIFASSLLLFCLMQVIKVYTSRRKLYRNVLHKIYSPSNTELCR